MWDVVRNLVTDGSTVLLTTQYLDEADALADEISVIDHGRVIAHDTPDGLKRVIGGHRIMVRPTNADDVQRAVGVLTAIGSSAPEVTARNTITVPVTGEAALAATVERLAAEGISVTELSLHLPSLDEVFMTLTGRTTNSDSDLDPTGRSSNNHKEVAA